MNISNCKRYSFLGLDLLNNLSYRKNLIWCSVDRDYKIHDFGRPVENIEYDDNCGRRIRCALNWIDEPDKPEPISCTVHDIMWDIPNFAEKYKIYTKIKDKLPFNMTDFYEINEECVRDYYDKNYHGYINEERLNKWKQHKIDFINKVADNYKAGYYDEYLKNIENLEKEPEGDKYKYEDKSGILKFLTVLGCIYWCLGMVTVPSTIAFFKALSEISTNHLLSFGENWFTLSLLYTTMFGFIDVVFIPITLFMAFYVNPRFWKAIIFPEDKYPMSDDDKEKYLGNWNAAGTSTAIGYGVSKALDHHKQSPSE